MEMPSENNPPEWTTQLDSFHGAQRCAHGQRYAVPAGIFEISIAQQGSALTVLSPEFSVKLLSVGGVKESTGHRAWSS